MAKKLAFYHGEQAPKMFTFECGNCHMPVDEKDHYCKWCGSRFSYTEKEDNNKSENA